MWLLPCYYYFTSLYGKKKKKWAKLGGHIVLNLWRLSISCCALISNPLNVQFRSGFPLRIPQQNPVSVSLQSTGPGENVSLLWLHIKIQNVSLKELIQTALNPLHASIVP